MRVLCVHVSALNALAFIYLRMPHTYAFYTHLHPFFFFLFIFFFT